MEYFIRIIQGDVKSARVYQVGKVKCSNLRAAQKLSNIINRNDEGFEARAAIRFHIHGNAIEIAPSYLDLAYIESEFAEAIKNIRDGIGSDGVESDEE